MSIYFTKEKIELSNWDFSIDPNNPIDCESRNKTSRDLGTISWP